jgi:hypothetical protein
MADAHFERPGRATAYQSDGVESKRRQLTVFRRGHRTQVNRWLSVTLEEADAITEQYWCDVHDHLVEYLRFETLASNGCTEHTDVSSRRRFLRNRDRVTDVSVDELADYPFDDRRISGWIVTKHEERPTERSAVETRLLSVLDILGPSPNKQRSRRPYDLVDRLTRAQLCAEGPAHLVVRARNKPVEAHERVPAHQLCHSRLLSSSLNHCNQQAVRHYRRRVIRAAARWPYQPTQKRSDIGERR